MTGFKQGRGPGGSAQFNRQSDRKAMVAAARRSEAAYKGNAETRRLYREYLEQTQKREEHLSDLADNAEVPPFIDKDGNRVNPFKGMVEVGQSVIETEMDPDGVHRTAKELPCKDPDEK